MQSRLFFYLAYLNKPAWDTGISPPELLDFIKTHAPGRALDLGCGTGTNAITLAKSGWQVTGVDFTHRAIKIAKQKTQRNGIAVDFRLDDVRRLDSITDQFDLILDLGCFHSLVSSDHPKYIATVDRLLSPTGTYLLYVFFKNQAKSFGPGVTKEAIDSLLLRFELITRTDGTERWIRPSAWFSFRKRT